MRRPFVLALLAGVLVGGAAVPLVASATRTQASGVREWAIHYRAHDGRTRAAYVLLPAWYGPRHDPPLPLVVSPHGRGVDGRANASLWGDLPGLDAIAVVNPDGEGRRLPLYSWGYSGQVDDLAKLPAVVQQALPWLRVKPDSVYGVAGSMGGQELLLLLARHPHLLEGAAVVDAPTDLALQYRNFATLPCNAACLKRWQGPIGRGLQQLARTEVGGTPEQDPAAYAERSPMHFAREIAQAGAPVGLWWSRRDRITGAGDQEADFFQALELAHPSAPVLHNVGRWTHDRGFRLNLRHALAWLHLA
jgi:pimeloyl-ACP methyl ester carboxylesterase